MFQYFLDTRQKNRKNTNKKQTVVIATYKNQQLLLQPIINELQPAQEERFGYSDKKIIMLINNIII